MRFASFASDEGEIATRPGFYGPREHLQDRKRVRDGEPALFGLIVLAPEPHGVASAKAGIEKHVLIAWDRAARASADETEGMAELALSKGFEVREISTLDPQAGDAPSRGVRAVHEDR